MRSPRRSCVVARGFTLVELVVVIVVLGILSVGTVRFVRDAGDGYATTTRRSELGSTARLAVERLSRELRRALPNSVRVSGACIEFVPIVAASTYLAVPVGTAASTFAASPPMVTGDLTNVRIAVGAADTASLYALGDPAPISPVATFSAPDADNVVTVSLAAPHRFSVESAEQRFFVVSDPVSYCAAGGFLYRYERYGFQALQPTAATLPASLPRRAVVGERLDAGATSFALAPATLSRNAVVALDLEFGEAGDRATIDHLVQLRNVP